MITLQKINDQKVKPIKVTKYDPANIQSYELFEELYTNIFLLAKKKSGKTCTIFTVLKKVINKKTTVIIFASTVHKDDNWIAIVKWLKKHKINVETHTSIFDDGINQVENLMSSLGIPSKEEDKEKAPKPKKLLHFDDDSDEEDESKPKKIAPEYVLIFDDLSSELKNHYIPVLLKGHRHYKTKIIISSQYYNDIPKDGRQQIDYVLLYPNIPEDKLIVVYQKLDLSVPYPTFQQLYSNATSTKYNFLYVDVRNERFRKNFSHEYKIPIM